MALKEIWALDGDDPLADKRHEFILPEDRIYLDGNSLGPLTKRSKQRVEQLVVEQWGQDLIQSWNKHQWIDLPNKVGEKIAKLIGAAPGQVICCDSISVNLFKLLASALTLNSPRSIILSQTDNFPTDLYMAEGLAGLLGEKRCQLKQVNASKLEESIDESVAVLLLTEVNFRTGELHDMQRITELAHTNGVLVIWDLAHSAGALPVELDRCKVDFAVGCGYKYLNGGPGAPAFLYVAKRHQEEVQQPVSGWMGHRAPFDFENHYHAAPDVTQFLAGTHGILSMASLDSALDVFEGIDLRDVREKSIKLSSLFMTLVVGAPALAELKRISPVDPNKRGSQLAFTHPSAFSVSQALIDRGVIVDFRAPNIIRFGFTPLFTRFQDIWEAVNILIKIVEDGIYRQEKFKRRNKVT